MSSFVKPDAELRVRETEFAEAQKVARFGSWYLDIASGKIQWSDDLYCIFKIDKSGFNGEFTSFLSRVLPEDRPSVLQVVEEAKRLGRPFEIVYRIMTPDGTLKTIRDIGSALRDATGKLVSLLGTAQDITRQVQIKEDLRQSRHDLELLVLERTEELEKANIALKNSKDYLDMIINSISDPIYVKDRQHRLVLVNDAACKLFAQSREDIIGKTAYDLFPAKEMADISWQKDEEVFIGGMENINEEINTYAPGITRNVLVQKAPFTDFHGNQLLVGITRDITEQKKAQDQIHFQAGLLDQVSNIVIAIDLDGNVIFWNKFAETLLQWTAEEILGRNIADTIVPESELKAMREVVSYLMANSSFAGEFQMMKKDGSTISAFQSFSTIKDGLGSNIGMVSVAVDITERKRAEEALNKAKEDAEAAAKAKSEFLANMSHEIRTPMNAVIGLTELLQMTDLNPEQRDYVETIRNSGDFLLTIINNLLDFSKIDSGKIDLESRPFDLSDCIENSLDLVATEASKKGLNLSCAIIPGASGTILGDPSRLSQILLNLLNNAIKFTDSGEVIILASARKINGNIHEVHFEVRDTGIGIPADKLNRLFQPFSQVDASTTRKYGGTGLGLAISKRLVEIMGGRIWAESDEGKGSSFHFTILATYTTEKPARLKDTASQPGMDLDSSQMPSLRILLAEDNPVNQMVALKMLRKIGLLADLAANGFEVLQALERQTYDIILMDIQMPEMDGLEAARRIRQRWHNGPKIIAMTAYALDGDMDRCLKAGMDDYISKPIQMDDLQYKLIKWGKERRKE